MTKIVVCIAGASAYARKTGELTSGMVGVPVQFEFDEAWEGLNITAVFEGGDVVKDQVLDKTYITVVPHEVLASPGVKVSIGAEGRDANGKLVIPSTMAVVGRVAPGADPSGDESTDPSLPVWAQIQEEIAKLKEQSGGEIDPADVQRIVEKYLQDNPPAAGYTPVKGKDYYTEADKQEMVNAVLAALPVAEGVSY